MPVDIFRFGNVENP